MLKSLFGSVRRAGRRPRDFLPGDAVVFITMVDRPYRIEPGHELESEQASMRLRVGIPARELSRRVPVWLAPLGHVAGDPGLEAFGRVGAVVVGKPPVRFFTEQGAAAAQLLDWIERAARERSMLVDFSDDLAAAAAMYSIPMLAEVQQRLLRACPASVPTAALAERLAPGAPHGVTVIEDPYESLAAQAPRFAPEEALRLAWFGVFGSPLKTFITNAFAGIARALAPRPVDLAFVTYANQAPLVEEMAGELRAASPSFSVRHVPWSVLATASELDRADLVVVPQDAASDWGRVKSHNRLVESIRAGRFAVVSPVPSYAELGEFAWVGDDLAAGVAWALAHPRDVVQRLGAGQAYVAKRFAPEVIAARWAHALGVPVSC